MLRDGYLFSTGRLSLERLLERGYARLAGLDHASLDRVYARMRRTGNAREAIAALKSHGYLVLLLSSGVPDRFVRKLAQELGADEGAGIELGVTNGVLNGSIHGILTREDGKVTFVRRWLQARGLTWGQAVVVGDDDNNLGLMDRAGTSIGMHAAMQVRRKADFLAERDNLFSIVPLVTATAIEPPRPKARVEIARRLVHMTAFAWPFVASLSIGLTVALLCLASGLYCLSEYLRLHGISFPAFGPVTRGTLREPERRRFAIAPLTLAGGVLFSLAFPHPIPFVAVGIVAFGDSIAGIVGQFFGRHPLFHSPKKSFEGTATSVIVSFGVALVLLPLPESLLIAVTASVVESLPLGDWDNLTVPASVALLCLALGV